MYTCPSCETELDTVRANFIAAGRLSIDDGPDGPYDDLDLGPEVLNYYCPECGADFGKEFPATQETGVPA